MRKHAESQPDPLALRHIFAWVSSSKGCTTIACARELQAKGVDRQVERLVESYQSKSAEEPPCRQLLPIPNRDAYALSVFTPLGDTPDGRPGNFWAETFVVPAEWLKQGDWDADRAFEELCWWGPEAREAALLPHPPADPLPPLQPGPLSRLARLVEEVPANHLQALLLAVVQMSDGLGYIRLVEGERVGALEEVISRLPLVVPPGCRLYRDRGRMRCLSFRTRSPLGGMAETADITGFPQGPLPEGGVLIDLSGRIAPPVNEKGFGAVYAHWLAQTLTRGAWDELEQLYENAAQVGQTDFFSRFKSYLATSPSTTKRRTPPAPPAPVAATLEVAEGVSAAALEPAPTIPVFPGDEGPAAAPNAEEVVDGFPEPVTSPRPARPPTSTPHADGDAPNEPFAAAAFRAMQNAWADRRALEGQAWRSFEKHREQLQVLVEELCKELEERTNRARTDLRRMLDELEDRQDKDFTAIRSEFEKASKRSRQQSESLDKKVEDRLAHLDDLRTQLKKIQKRLQALERGRRAAAIAVVEGDGAVHGELDSYEETEIHGGERYAPTIKPHHLSEWVRSHRLWLSAATVIVLVLGGWFLVKVLTRETPQERGAEQEARVQLSSLVERTQDGRLAAAVLERAQDERDIREAAALETVTLALAHGVEVEATTDCALLQAALRSEAAARGAATGPTVDGDCGPATIGMLMAARMDPCCRNHVQTNDSQAIRRLANCFLADYLELGQHSAAGVVEPEACEGASPWRAGRVWSTEEALAALTLFRGTARLAEEAQKTDSAVALRELDPLSGSRMLDALRRQTLASEEAERVLELYWFGVTGRRRALDTLALSEVAELERRVRETARGASR